MSQRLAPAARLRVLDLFSGVGGFSYGLESTGGFRTVAFCEVEPFPREVLAVRWPGVPVFDDVRELRGDYVGAVDVVAGGFPCQDVSVAGRGAGLEGARSGLWAEMLRLVRELRPAWVLAENVPALRVRGADTVLADLEDSGYSVWPSVVGAWAVGAPHRRDRVWILAHRDGHPLRFREQREPGRRSDRVRDQAGALPGDVRETGLVDGLGPGLEGYGRNEPDPPGREGPPARPTPAAGLRRREWPARRGEPQHEWEAPRLADPELAMGGSTHGVSARVVRRWNRAGLTALGNSVVPEIVATFGEAILKAEAGTL